MIWCRVLRLHAWRPWDAPKVGRRLADGKFVGQMLYQRRTCRRCSRVKFRKVAT